MNRRRALLIMGATAVCAGFVATLSHATAPGTNGRIAFMRYRLHDAPYQAELFTVNSDGSGARKLTHVAPGYTAGTEFFGARRAGSSVGFQCGPFGGRALFENAIAVGASYVHGVHLAPAESLERGGSSIWRRFFLA